MPDNLRAITSPVAQRSTLAAHTLINRHDILMYNCTCFKHIQLKKYTTRKQHQTWQRDLIPSESLTLCPVATSCVGPTGHHVVGPRDISVSVSGTATRPLGLVSRHTLVSPSVRHQSRHLATY